MLITTCTTMEIFSLENELNPNLSHKGSTPEHERCYLHNWHANWTHAQPQTEPPQCHD